MSGEPPHLGTYGGWDIYPMPMFATLSCPDPAELASWYERALGFGTVFAGPLIHLRRHRYQDLLVVRGDGPAKEAPAAPVLSFAADGEIEALAARAHAVERVGRSSVEGPLDTPWNSRDLRVTDPVGHRLVFTARRPDPDPEISRRWKEAFEAGRPEGRPEISGSAKPTESGRPG